MTEREIDCLVAEKVMEWKPRGPHPVLGSLVFATGSNDTLAPRFSTDIAEAWKVVELMVASGHLFIVKGDGLRSGDHNPKWTVLCDNLPREDAAAAPLAICRAALRAVGVEVPE